MEKKLWENPKEVADFDEAQNPLWFWNDRLTTEELIRQLHMKTDVGVKSTIPHARLNNGDGYIGGYLDEDWFEKIHCVLNYKKEHNETMWLYDEMDWPAGTCNKTITKDEKNREQYLYFQTIELSAGETFRSQIGEGAWNICILNKETDAVYDLQPYIESSQFSVTIDFTAEEDCVIYLVEIRVDSYEHWGAGCVNYLDADVTDLFLKSTYDVYFENCKEYFGNTIKAVFNDETRMANAFPWSKDFADEFQKRKGYDFLPHIFSLILSGDIHGRYRCDYYDVVATLFQENFFGKIQKWCHEHQIKLFAHLLGEETLASQVRYSGDFMRQIKYLDIAGADHLGKGIGSLNIKFTSSAARSYGIDKTAVEVFAGCGWDMTFEEYIRMISWMFQQGMQSIINHGFFYSTRDTRKDDWPPSQFFQWNGWENMEQGNAMVRRLHYAFTNGMPENDILVYYPIETFWMEYIGNQFYKHGYEKGPLVTGEKAKELDENIQVLLQKLSCENLDFELLHNDAVDNFTVNTDKIQNQKNQQSFQVLLFPWVKIISIRTMRLVVDFIKNGGKLVVLGELPVYVMEKENQKEFDSLRSELEDSHNVVFFSEKQENAVLEYLQETVKQPIKLMSGMENNHKSYTLYTNGLIDPYVHTGEDICGVRFVRYIKDGKRNTFFVNYDAEPKAITVELEAEKDISIWNPFTGEIKEPNVLFSNEHTQRIFMILPCNYGIIMVSDL